MRISWTRSRPLYCSSSQASSWCLCSLESWNSLPRGLYSTSFYVGLYTEIAEKKYPVSVTWVWLLIKPEIKGIRKKKKIVIEDFRYPIYYFSTNINKYCGQQKGMLSWDPRSNWLFIYHGRLYLRCQHILRKEASYRYSLVLYCNRCERGTIMKIYKHVSSSHDSHHQGNQHWSHSIALSSP